MSRRRFPISLAMIVRDEARVLARCLDSVTGLVDEIVIVDTGSLDDTVAIATSYGAKVHQFTWIDDFAAARNHALSHATHPWRLVLDADEWIVDRDAAKKVLDRISAMTPDFAGGIDWLQVDETGALIDGVVPQSIIRLLPRQLNYVGKIHEQPYPEIRAVRLHLTVGHSGYTSDSMARKEGRNAEILIRELEADPENAYLWYQLGNEYVSRDREADALPYLVQAYNLLHPAHPGPDAPRQIDWWHRVTMRLLMALTVTGRHDDAVALGEIEALAWPDSPDLHYVLGCAVRAQAVSLRETDRARADDLMVTSLGLWLHATTLKDQQRYAGILAGRGTELAAERVAQDYAAMGRTEEAQRYHRIAAGESVGIGA